MIQNDGGNSVYQWSIIELGLVAVCVCVCGAADFSVRKSHSLMDWIIFRLFGICDVNSKSLWQHWINAITSGREYHGLFGNGKHRTGKRNQLILMIMQRQKILE